MESALIQSNLMYSKFRRYLSVVSKVTGEDEAVILNTHRYPYSHYRGIIASMLSDDGYSLHEIGKALGRAHCTVYNAIQLARGSANNPTKRDVYEIMQQCLREVGR